jgi:hypothetical protein
MRTGEQLVCVNVIWGKRDEAGKNEIRLSAAHLNLIFNYYFAVQLSYFSIFTIRQVSPSVIHYDCPTSELQDVLLETHPINYSHILTCVNSSRRACDWNKEANVVRERGYVLDYIRTCTRTHPLIESIAMNGMVFSFS